MAPVTEHPVQIEGSKIAWPLWAVWLERRLAGAMRVGVPGARWAWAKLAFPGLNAEPFVIDTAALAPEDRARIERYLG